ncbi:MAG: hypothetical protein ABSB56_07585 [Nitrososphaerales archaeon]|jgi:hypothetical protein
MGGRIKGIFNENGCPLDAKFNTTFTHPTKKISAGILKSIYESLNPRQRLLWDYLAYAGERIGCLSGNTGDSKPQHSEGLRITAFQRFNGKYGIINIESHQTKARYPHICILPIDTFDAVIRIQSPRSKAKPFPSAEEEFKAITAQVQAQFGVRVTAHYLRKRFHTIASRTKMPVNDWDFLMGDKKSAGHHANTYNLEDWSELVEEYDRFLAPYLSTSDPRDPLDTTEPTESSKQEVAVLLETVATLNKTIEELRQQTRLALNR